MAGFSEEFDSCSASYFNQSYMEVCDHHIFDEMNSGYKTSFVTEFDIPPCIDMDDGWPFKVTFKEKM